jgi:hypothetical protein
LHRTIRYSPFAIRRFFPLAARHERWVSRNAPPDSRPSRHPLTPSQRVLTSSSRTNFSSRMATCGPRMRALRY